MKKITVLLVIIFTFLFSTTSWGDWSYGSESLNGSIKLYYDKDRIRKSRKYIYFWELSDYIKPNEYGSLSSTKYIELDCSIFRYKILRFQTYNKSMGGGKMTTDMTPKGEQGEWRYPIPKSTGEILYNKVCEEHQ